MVVDFSTAIKLSTNVNPTLERWRFKRKDKRFKTIKDREDKRFKLKDDKEKK